MNKLDEKWNLDYKKNKDYLSLKSQIIESIETMLKILLVLTPKSNLENHAKEEDIIKNLNNLAIMLFKEWKLKKEGKICVYASRSKQIDAIAKALSDFAEWFSQLPIDNKKIKDLKFIEKVSSPENVKKYSFANVYNMMSKVYNGNWDGKIQEKIIEKQARILDLCWTEYGKKDGIEINFY